MFTEMWEADQRTYWVNLWTVAVAQVEFTGIPLAYCKHVVFSCFKNVYIDRKRKYVKYNGCSTVFKIMCVFTENLKHNPMKVCSELKLQSSTYEKKS